MSVTTQQQYQSLQGTTVYVVDPEQLRQKVILKSFQLGKTSTNEGTKFTPVSDSGQGFGDKKPRKRRPEIEEIVIEGEDDVLYSKHCSKEVTTRAGRISKSKQTGSPPKVKESGPKIKKREPANVFRCPSCQKVYIGYSKLKLHFRKFPEHCNYTEDNSKDPLKLRKVPESSSTETQTDTRLNNHVEVAVQTCPELKSVPHNDVNAPQHNFPSFPLLLNGSHQTVPQLSHQNVPQTQTVPPTGLARINNFGNFISFKDVDTHKTLSEPVFDQLLPPSSSNLNCYNQPSGPKLVSPSVPMATAFLKHTNNHHSDCVPNGGLSLQRLVWDVVEEKMIQNGINEILADLSDVAEKLAKIARDKIIPIREEEEEQLRANNTAPIVLVDTPFLSHLLDLPFGTYMFKEDAGIRRLPPPPVAADLSLNSLTSGVEVDIDKFLPGIDLIHLPHLTNLDFSSICSDSS